MRLNSAIKQAYVASDASYVTTNQHQTETSVQAQQNPTHKKNDILLEEASKAYQDHYLKTHASNPSQFVSVWSADAKNTIDCCVVGAGQTGVSILALAQALPGLRLAAIDQAPRGQESIWRQARCRMPTLRTTMEADVSLGLSPLSMQRWWSTQNPTPFGSEDKLPTERVNDYLDFVREACALNHNIDWSTELIDWQLGPGHIELTFKSTQSDQAQQNNEPLHQPHPIKIKTRALILADGISGVSVPNIPARYQTLYTRENLKTGNIIPFRPMRQTQAALFHTQDDIPQSNLTGRDVLVIGGGASAYDAGIKASQQGASSVTLCQRGSQPIVNFLIESGKLQQRFHCDPFAAFPSMKQDTQSKLLTKIAECRMPPPTHTVTKFDALSNTSRQTGTEVQELSYEKGKFSVLLTGNPQAQAFDTIILGTGYKPSLSQKPLYAGKNIPLISKDTQQSPLSSKYYGLPQHTLHENAIIFANESTWTSVGADPGLTSLMPRAHDTLRQLVKVLDLDASNLETIIPKEVDAALAETVGQAMIEHLDQLLKA